MTNSNIEKSLKNKITTGVFWMLGEKFLGTLVSFLVSIVLARLLSPSQYGEVAIATLFLNLIASIFSSSLTSALVQKKDADHLDFNTIFWFSLLLNGLAYLILYFSAPFIAGLFNSVGSVSVIRVMSLSLFILAWNDCQHAYVSRNLIFKKFFFSSLFGTIFSGVVGVALAYFGFGVWALVIQRFCDLIIDAVVLAFMIKWHPKPEFSATRFKPLFRYGWKISLANFSGTLFDELKSFVIGIRYSAEDLAYYNKGQSLPNLFKTNIQGTLSSVLFPSYSKLQDDANAMKSIMKQTIRLSAFFLSPVFFGLAAVAPSLIIVLYSSTWEAAIPFMQVSCAIGLVGIVGQIDIQCFKALGETQLILRLEFVKKPILVVIVFVTMFISPLAIIVGMFVYNIIATFINSVFTKKLVGYGFFERIKDILPVVLLSLVMFLCVAAIGSFIDLNVFLTLLIQIAVGVTLYLTGVVIFFKDETKIIANIFNKTLKRKKTYQL